MSSLYIDRRGVEVRLDGEALAFYEKGARAGTIPLAPLERVFLRGDVILHANLLGKLGEKGIGVVVLSGRKAEPSLLMATPHNDASRRIAQFRMSQNPEFCLKISKQLMEKKLKGQIALLETILDGNFRHRFLVGHRQRFMKESLEKMAACADLASLRGLEGVAAREYFQALTEVLLWDFTDETAGRRKTPSTRYCRSATRCCRPRRRLHSTGPASTLTSGSTMRSSTAVNPSPATLLKPYVPKWIDSPSNVFANKRCVRKTFPHRTTVSAFLAKPAVSVFIRPGKLSPRNSAVS